MKTVRLPEFKKYRQFKQILLNRIRDHERSISLFSELYNEEHLELYHRVIDLSKQLIEIIEKIITKETKYQLPSLIDNDVKFVL